MTSLNLALAGKNYPLAAVELEVEHVQLVAVVAHVESFPAAVVDNRREEEKLGSVATSVMAAQATALGSVVKTPLALVVVKVEQVA